MLSLVVQILMIFQSKSNGEVRALTPYFIEAYVVDSFGKASDNPPM